MSNQKIEIVLDTHQCQGYGMCLMSEDIFEIPDGSQVAQLKLHEVDFSRESEIVDLVSACPAQAISFRILESA
ncbi:MULTISPECIES: ferredoxin [Acinetobacter]|uniref:ferredoxin n=1 Tax=Acinetobacter TaxID=469 RepID=UPI000B3C9429|nr:MULTISPECIES: ferredoxin [Acinetobacter]AXY59607.1 ferredoxin [Acinetobacter sp. WCHAc010052]WOE42621.1 ferredoxin [Acinetobacter chinensis]